MRWFWIIITIAALIIAGLVMWPGTVAPRHAYFDGLKDGTVVIAHRGARAHRPENTLLAFHAAEAMGADILEGDLHVTSDGAVVFVHDATLDRTTDRSGAVADLTLAEVQVADAAARFTLPGADTLAGSGVMIPTLGAVLEAHPDSRFILEIKPDDPAASQALCAELRAQKATMRVLVGSFHDAAMTAFRAACPEVATSMASEEVRNFYVLSLVGMTKFFSSPAVAMQIPEYADDIHLASPRMIAAAHARGIDVHVWTVNESADMHRLTALGVDGIITDHVDRMTRVLEERAVAVADCPLNATLAEAASIESENCRNAWREHNVRMHHIQTLGTHNSYKQAISESEMALIAAQSPELAAGLDYSHRPLAWQLERGARKFELDVFVDPDGGRFAAPLGPQIAGAQGLPVPPFDAADLAAPGFKVMHIQDVDYRSHCLRFVDCLAQLQSWSQANADHAPILVLINIKDAAIPLDGSTDPLPFDAAAYAALDAEIRSVFGLEDLITPDLLRGGFASLREAAAAGAWPRMKEARGRFMFALETSPEKAEVYRAGRPALEGRVMFINTGLDSPATAYRTLNDPIGQADAIRETIAAGVIVRTRADADTVEARTGETARRTAAFTSGAHYISTDYLEADTRFSDYTVALPGGGVARCNPVTGTDICGAAPLE